MAEQSSTPASAKAVKVVAFIAIVVVANVVFNELALDRVRDLDAPGWVDSVGVPDGLEEPLHWLNRIKNLLLIGLLALGLIAVLTRESRSAGQDDDAEDADETSTEPRS